MVGVRECGKGAVGHAPVSRHAPILGHAPNSGHALILGHELVSGPGPVLGHARRGGGDAACAVVAEAEKADDMEVEEEAAAAAAAASRGCTRPEILSRLEVSISVPAGRTNVHIPHIAPSPTASAFTTPPRPPAAVAIPKPPCPSALEAQRTSIVHLEPRHGPLRRGAPARCRWAGGGGGSGGLRGIGLAAEAPRPVRAVDWAHPNLNGARAVVRHFQGPAVARDEHPQRLCAALRVLPGDRTGLLVRCDQAVVWLVGAREQQPAIFRLHHKAERQPGRVVQQAQTLADAEARHGRERRADEPAKIKQIFPYVCRQRGRGVSGRGGGEGEGVSGGGGSPRGRRNIGSGGGSKHIDMWRDGWDRRWGNGRGGGVGGGRRGGRAASAVLWWGRARAG
eukprot:scaffold3737_cov137-Isochrysis_galbana.AAC.4